jgi:hypothetical protein
MANPASSVTDEKNNPQGNVPLFFERPVPLELPRHAKAGLFPSRDYSFTASTNSLLINGVEFVEAAKNYPIIFTLGESPIPAVILGLEGQNYFVDKEGGWQEDSYIPAYVRKYPFIFMDMVGQNQFALCIDEAAPHFKIDGGPDTLPLYEGNKPSALTTNALEFCTAYHNHHIMTRSFSEALKKANLLIPSQSNAILFNGRKIDLGGFQIIDEKKFNALPDKTILEFRKKGYLPLIYFALMSATHWNKLAQMAGKRESITAH